MKKLLKIIIFIIVVQTSIYAVSYPVKLSLGWRLTDNPFKNYFNSTYPYHPGVDINLGSGNYDLGKSVYSIACGEVVEVKNLTNLGQGIMIKHNFSGTTYYSTYIHINSKVSVGEKIEEGQEIATLADISSANMTAHLHLEIRKKYTTDWYPNDNGLGYYTDTSKIDLDGFIDPIQFINDNKDLYSCVSFELLNKRNGLIHFKGGIFDNKGKITITDGNNIWNSTTSPWIIQKWEAGKAELKLYSNGLNGTKFPLKVTVYADATGTNKIAEFSYPFTDVKGEQYTNGTTKEGGTAFSDSIIKLWKAGTVNGQNNLFNPEKNISQFEFVAMMYSHLNKKINTKSTWATCIDDQICSSSMNKNVDLTRVQAAKFLKLFYQKYTGSNLDCKIQDNNNSIKLCGKKVQKTRWSWSPSSLGYVTYDELINTVKCETAVWSDEACQIKSLNMMQQPDNPTSFLKRSHAAVVINRLKEAMKSGMK